jgi:tetratricopeptide (TPR) repeat protein
MTMGTTSIIMLVLLAQVLPGTPPPPDKVKAQGLISEGAILYEKGDYTSALDQFQAAYAAYPSARIWFNIGQTNRDLGRPVEALEAFQKFLDGVPDASPEDKADAQSSMADLQKRLGQLTIVCDAKGAEISVDGKPMGTAPLAKPVWAIPGLHQVLALQKDAAPAVESVKVNEGANTTVVLKSGQVATPATPAPPVEVATPSPTPESGNGWWLGRKWTWVAAGSTVLLAGAAAGIGLSVNSRYDELRNGCGSRSTSWPGCTNSEVDSLRTRKNIANVLWGLAGAAVVTTGVLFFIEGRPMTLTPVAGETTGIIARMEF